MIYFFFCFEVKQALWTKQIVVFSFIWINRVNIMNVMAVFLFKVKE